MRRLLLAACGVPVAVLTACGSPAPVATQTTVVVTSASPSPSAAPSSPAVPPTQATTAAPASNRCTADSLSAKAENSDAGAGNRYGKLVVTNKSGAECTLKGYSGLQLLDAGGQPVPTNLQRVDTPGPTPLTLAAGASAAANLHWTVVPTGSEPQDKPCEPEATSAAAIPPDETRPMSLTWGLGLVCGGGKIEISAFYAA
ncbi:DUF4232 domain-containing protein [Actinosynnema sp. NPDC020468]|uniref:DUF4232 domain-containing protein n=1 Tax=Actinosynnema sp. NPDC020468 TaxID=3154488 RepID=UPI0033FF5232